MVALVALACGVLELTDRLFPLPPLHFQLIISTFPTQRVFLPCLPTTSVEKRTGRYPTGGYPPVSSQEEAWHQSKDVVSKKTASILVWIFPLQSITAAMQSPLTEASGSQR